PSLYQECDAMFLPSLLECFSASYPEAMAMEKPIITVDLGFAHSICNDSALFFNPIDSTDALNKIEALRINADLRKNLILKGKKRLEDFPSSKERAVKYLEICEEISK
ncbi:MAG: glycosyltransferase, partial [Bacteroidota bacterium]